MCDAKPGMRMRKKTNNTWTNDEHIVHVDLVEYNRDGTIKVWAQETGTWMKCEEIEIVPEPINEGERIMNVLEYPITQTKRFKDLKQGEVFRFSQGSGLYIKTERTLPYEYVSLKNGAVYRASTTKEVIPLEPNTEIKITVNTKA